MPVSDAQATEFVNAHNAVRQRIAQAESQRLGGSVVIPAITWDASLAALAQDWANQQAAQLQAGQMPQHRPNNPNGENMFWGTAGAYTPTDAVNAWASEQAFYNYDQNTCSAPANQSCGHYTQVVWANSLRIGCGSATGGGQDIFVCDYAPAGNIVGERPYSVSAAPATVTISPSTLPGATAGVFYTQQLSASGGQAPYSFSATGLPDGLILETSGRLHGATNRFGTFYVTITVTDATGASAQQAFTLDVAPPTATEIQGQLTDQGQPAAGVTVELYQYVPGGGQPIARTTTDANGHYVFTNVAPLGSSQSYRVQFTNSQGGGNTPNPQRLALRVSQELAVLREQEQPDLGSMELMDIALSTPADGAVVTLPTTFTWGSPQSSLDTSCLFITDAQGHELWTHPTTSTSFTVDVTTAQQSGLQVTATTYRWQVFVVTNSDWSQGYGQSNTSWTVSVS